MSQDFTLFKQRLEEAGWNKEQIQAILETASQSIYQKKYGLVWEDHPEPIEEQLKTHHLSFEEVVERRLELGGEDSPQHLLIEGDNYEVLKLLQVSHKGLIDVIYIDPPYNRGMNDFRYNDDYVKKDNEWKHSYWLSFMNKRLLLAKNLLSDDGVIFISIDDHEMAQLKLLCDEIFGERNFIAMFIWEKTQHFGRQKKNIYSNGDYILCYAKDLMLTKGTKQLKKELLVEYQKNTFEDAPLYNKSNKERTLIFEKNTVKFNIPDGVYNISKDSKYVLNEPVIVENSTNKNDLILTFKSRWQQSTVNTHIANNGTFVVKSINFAIRAVYGDRDGSNESPKQLLFSNKSELTNTVSRFMVRIGTSEEGSNALKEIVPDADFDYPKPVSLIHYLLSLVFNHKNGRHENDLIILDFFAGSGTTGQAVLELNEKDQGNRQFILCTNNENNICEEVTYERLKRVIQGYTTAKGKEVEGIPANLKYLKTKLEPKEEDE